MTIFLLLFSLFTPRATPTTQQNQDLAAKIRVEMDIHRPTTSNSTITFTEQKLQQ